MLPPTDVLKLSVTKRTHFIRRLCVFCQRRAPCRSSVSASHESSDQASTFAQTVNAVGRLLCRVKVRMDEVTVVAVCSTGTLAVVRGCSSLPVYDHLVDAALCEYHGHAYVL